MAAKYYRMHTGWLAPCGTLDPDEHGIYRLENKQLSRRKREYLSIGGLTVGEAVEHLKLFPESLIIQLEWGGEDGGDYPYVDTWVEATPEELERFQILLQKYRDKEKQLKAKQDVLQAKADAKALAQLRKRYPEQFKDNAQE